MFCIYDAHVTWCFLRQVSSLKGPIFDAFVMALLHYFQLSTEQVTLEEWFRKGNPNIPGLVNV